MKSIINYKQSLKIFKLSLPIIFAHVGQMLLHSIDSIMLGHINSISLAAAAFAGNVINIFLLFSIGIGTAVRILIANCSGGNRINEEKNYLMLSISICSIFAFFVFCLIYYGNSFLSFFNQPIEVVILSKEYLNFLAFSLLPLLSYRCLRVYAEAKNKSWIPFKVLIAGLCLNVFLNWIMIFGHFGFPRFELYGAGLATLISRIFMLIAIIFLLRKDKDLKLYLPWRKFRFSFSLVKYFFKLVLPFSIQQMSEWGFFIFLGIMAGWDGTLALTSHSIAYSYLTILFNIPLSISAVISIQISKHLGENNLKLCRSTGINGIAFCSSIMFVISIFLYLFRLYFPLVFTDDYSTIELTSTILIFMSPVLLFDSMQCLMMGILRGMQDTKRPTIYAFISYWVIGIPIIYFFTKIFQFKVLGIWMGLLITLILISVSLFYRLSKVFNFQKQIDNVQIKTQPSD